MLTFVYVVYNIVFNVAALWLGRIILSLIIFLLVSGTFYYLYFYFFLMPHCPKCGSRRTGFLIGNNSGGYRCEKCEERGIYTYYWWEKKNCWYGKTYTKDPIGLMKRLEKKGLVSRVFSSNHPPYDKH